MAHTIKTRDCHIWMDANDIINMSLHWYKYGGEVLLQWKGTGGKMEKKVDICEGKWAIRTPTHFLFLFIDRYNVKHSKMMI